MEIQSYCMEIQSYLSIGVEWVERMKSGDPFWMCHLTMQSPMQSQNDTAWSSPQGWIKQYLWDSLGGATMIPLLNPSYLNVTEEPECLERQCRAKQLCHRCLTFTHGSFNQLKPTKLTRLQSFQRQYPAPAQTWPKSLSCSRVCTMIVQK